MPASKLFVGLYRLCLLAYPREFRADCATEMIETLRVRQADLGGRIGMLPMLRFRLRELHAVVRTGLRLRFRGDPGLIPGGTGDRPAERRPGMADSVAQDVRHALRCARKNPLVTGVAVATLGIGIGATTSIFSVIDGVLLRGLPYDEPERLVEIINTLPEAGISFAAMSIAELEAWQQQDQIFERLEGYADDDFILTGGKEPQRIPGARATVGLIDLLGIRPHTGRGFGVADTEAGSDHVVIISDGMWRRRFGASPTVLGESLTINDESHVVIGVMPRGFHFPRLQTEFWIPLNEAATPEVRSSLSVRPLARIRPGIDLARGQELVEAVSRGMKEQKMRPEHWGIELRAKNDDRAAGQASSLYVVSGAVGFVLLIACANIANLALARATIRRSELSLRAALGASRLRIARQVLTESVVVGLLGGAVGVTLTFWLLGTIVRLAPAELTVLSDTAIRIDLRVLAFATAVSVLAGAVSGLAPAVRGSRPGNDLALARSGHLRSGSARSRLRGALVVAEVALSLILLIGAGLMVESFTRLQGIDPGLDPENLLVVELELDEERYPTGVQRQAFFDELAAMVRELPGSEAVTVAIGAPPQGGFVEVGTNPAVEGRPDETAATTFLATTNVGPGYFRTLRIPLASGRAFGVGDYTEGTSAVIINTALARRLWGEDDPVGARLRLAEDRPWLTVVGVAADVKLMGLDDEYGELEMYYPLTDDEEGYLPRSLIVRTRAAPLDLAATIKDQIWSLDANLPVDRVATMEQLFYESLATPRFYLLLMGSFALVAAVLAAVGIYGVTAYAVGQRTHEIGVRVALGAERRNVLSLVVGRGMRHVAAGMLLGLGGAIALSRTLGSMLFEMPATEPVTYAGVSALLAGVALVACYIPARRATRADPLETLRGH